MVSSHIVVAGGLIAEFSAAVLLAQVGSTTATSDLFDDAKLTALCVLGAMMGAFLSIALFPPRDADSDKTKLQKLALKFGSSLFTGVAFTPMLIQYFKMQLTPDWVVGVSTAVAAVGVMAIHIGMPYAQKWLDRFFGSKVQ